MTDAIELKTRLEELKRKYRGERSLIEMLEKSTPREVLQKMRKEKLVPIEQGITKLEHELKRVLSRQK